MRSLHLPFHYQEYLEITLYTDQPAILIVYVTAKKGHRNQSVTLWNSQCLKGWLADLHGDVDAESYNQQLSVIQIKGRAFTEVPLEGVFLTLDWCSLHRLDFRFPCFGLRLDLFGRPLFLPDAFLAVFLRTTSAIV